MASAQSKGSTRLPTAFPMVNNFDLIRLIAAVQVVYFHIQFHLHPQIGPVAIPLHRVLGPLTGVPIFFLISGFLVSSSFERRRDLAGYFRSRLARIYPALLVCLAVTLVILAVAGDLAPVVARPKFAAWVVAQATIGQAAHLAAFRVYATGAPNASLWTIPVEVLFYAGVPILYLLLLDRVSRRTGNLILGAIIALSFLTAAAMARLDPNDRLIAVKLLAETPLPYLYLFLTGVTIQRNFDVLSRWIVGQVAWWAVAYYLVVSLVRTQPCTVALGWCAQQSSAPDATIFLVSQLVLAGLVFSFAFSAAHLSGRLLNGGDPSYGTYLFHMLLVNVAVEAGVAGGVWIGPVVLIASVAIGWLSWRLVERPALKRWRRAPASSSARAGRGRGSPRCGSGEATPGCATPPPPPAACNAAINARLEMRDGIRQPRRDAPAVDHQQNGARFTNTSTVGRKLSGWLLRWRRDTAAR